MIAKPGTKLEVRPRPSPWRRVLWVLGLVALVTALTWTAYILGLERAGFLRADAQRLRQELRTQNEALARKNAELKESLARAERQHQVTAKAYEELDASLQASTQTIADLREELNFYRNIVTPANKERGLQIQDLAIEPVGVADQYRYKLVLIQTLEHKRYVKGKVGIEVVGIQDGAERTVNIEDAEDSPLSVKFRYFQRLIGTIRLPTGFKPTRVRVRLSANGDRDADIERWYDWPLA
jgi:uncharacterized membrane-anchored protein YhcB (DUF1043 family)